MKLGARRRAMAARAWLSAALALLVAACAPSPELEIRDAAYRPPLGAGTVGAAYFSIESSIEDRIVAVSSELASAVEIHETIVENGRASMRPLPTFELPAGEAVELAPGGVHLMVIGPYPLEGRTTFPITIQLESGRLLQTECTLLEN